ncbi:hypothetical protein PR048_030384 [Dryococelus australis]|uniref:Inosine/uridine-preferring nucleoside hydrolase domain-containing protein n=1 Tax=Dryococelus australis TaxID=614101 RepID=A0ABQ9GBP4_9NEOP|nr:hypothetical protein PR048_030384 [Dryococelus australis]
MSVRGALRLVVDVDVGSDDAMALMMCAAAERRGAARLLAVTCVHGNTNLDNVCVNTLKTLHTIGRLDVSAIPSFTTASLPLSSSLVHSFFPSSYPRSPSPYPRSPSPSSMPCSLSHLPGTIPLFLLPYLPPSLFFLGAFFLSLFPTSLPLSLLPILAPPLPSSYPRSLSFLHAMLPLPPPWHNSSLLPYLTPSLHSPLPRSPPPSSVPHSLSSIHAMLPLPPSWHNSSLPSSLPHSLPLVFLKIRRALLRYKGVFVDVCIGLYLRRGRLCHSLGDVQWKVPTHTLLCSLHCIGVNRATCMVLTGAEEQRGEQQHLCPHLTRHSPVLTHSFCFIFLMAWCNCGVVSSPADDFDVRYGSQIPVYRGAGESLVDTFCRAEDIHGGDGFGDFVYDDPPDVEANLQKEHAVTFLTRTVRENPGGIHGPNRRQWLPNLSLPRCMSPCMISFPCRRKGLALRRNKIPPYPPGFHLYIFVDCCGLRRRIAKDWCGLVSTMNNPQVPWKVSGSTGRSVGPTMRFSLVSDHRVGLVLVVVDSVCWRRSGEIPTLDDRLGGERQTAPLVPWKGTRGMDRTPARSHAWFLRNLCGRVSEDVRTFQAWTLGLATGRINLGLLALRGRDSSSPSIGRPKRGKTWIGVHWCALEWIGVWNSVDWDMEWCGLLCWLACGVVWIAVLIGMRIGVLIVMLAAICILLTTNPFVFSSTLEGPLWLSGLTVRLPPRRTGFNTGRAGRMTLVGGFSIPPPLHLHSGSAPYSPRFTLVGSQALDVQSRPNLFAHIHA